MKFILNYRTELSTFLLVPIGALRWYRFVRYSGTDSCAMMVPFRRYYHFMSYPFLAKANEIIREKSAYKYKSSYCFFS
ncbi:hypothetical protein J8K77_19880 [Bacteroides fragilis]|uniref:hypothetical protein n=1 Tax=Bacteroides fragilis TaxID=817 RepID=UPI00202F68FE|nr:hypothetical protein [Bacteroides fragilis]MCM0374651.1 hypothetical protein [Bacteroides fragilis]MCM0390146.1 hypothetical protein [Bacteroides fragilis]